MNLTPSRSMRALAIAVLATVLFSSMLCAVTPSASATVPAFITDSSEAREVFNWTFEKETINTRPDLGWTSPSTSLYHSNVTVLAVDGGYLHNKALRMSAEGNTSGMVKGTAYLGSGFTGIVSVSYDIKVLRMARGLAGDWDQTFEIGSSGTQNSVDTMNINIMYRNTTHVTVYYAGAAYSIAKPINQWITITQVHNTDNDTVMWFMDGVYLKTQSKAQTIVGYITFNLPKHTKSGIAGVTQITDVLIDNVAVRVEDSLTVPDPTDARSALALIFDDAYQSTVDLVLPVMGSEPASTAIITKYTDEEIQFGGVDVVNWTGAQQLVNAGWELMSHGYDHESMATLSEADLREALSKSQELIEENTGQDCKGLIYPASSRNAWTDSIAYEYYEYMRLNTVEFSQWDLTTWSTSYGNTVDAKWGFFPMARLIPCIIYGSHQFIGTMGHNVIETGPFGAYDISLDAYELFIAKLKNNDTRFVTPSDYFREYRNARDATITLDGANNTFEVSYPVDGKNRAMDKVWIYVPGTYENVEYVTVGDDGEISYQTVPGHSIMTVFVGSGDHDIMTLVDYRNMVMNNSIAPIFAIVPLVVIASIIPMVLGLGRKLH